MSAVSGPLAREMKMDEEYEGRRGDVLVAGSAISIAGASSVMGFIASAVSEFGLALTYAHRD